jgi:hypothetical protein
MPVDILPPLPLVLLLPPSLPVSSFETLGLPPQAATVPIASSDAQPSAVHVLYKLQNLSKRSRLSLKQEPQKPPLL